MSRPSSPFSRWLPIPVLVFAGGCAVGPDYHRPSALTDQPTPAAFSVPSTNGNPEWKNAEPAAHLPRGSWWQVFNDVTLDHLETTAEANSPSLAAAFARLQESRAIVNVARA